MAKRSRSKVSTSLGTSLGDIQDAKTEAVAIQKNTERRTDKAKDKNKRNQKVLYVSPEHHHKAKAAAFAKGFTKLRDYIEHLIDAAGDK